MSESEQLVVPQAPEAEEAVLGALTLAGQLGPDVAASVADAVRDTGLEPGDFYRPSHGQIYKTALVLFEQGQPVDPITMAAALERQGLLETIGGRSRIAELHALTTSTTNAGHHAHLVREAAIRRRALTLALSLAAAASDGTLGERADLLDGLRDLRPAFAATGAPTQHVSIVPLADFATTAEEGSEPLVGTEDECVIASGGTVMTYGDGGTGKTTYVIDAVAHLASGTTWLGHPVPRPLRILIIEDEGPRPPFRKKLARKIRDWDGAAFAHNVYVMDGPWAAFTFEREDHRDQLATFVRDLNIDVVVANPIVDLGFQGGGTPDEVRVFDSLTKDFRRRVGRPCVLWFVHHENKAGDVSGAFARWPDTTMNLRIDGKELSTLWFRKARWAPNTHGQKIKLRWLMDTAGFKAELVTPDTEHEKAIAVENATRWILDYVTDHPGEPRSKVENAYHEAHEGGRNTARRAIDQQLATLATWHNGGEQSGEVPPVLATTTGKPTNGTYLIPFTDAASPLATTPYRRGGEVCGQPPNGEPARHLAAPYKGEASGGEVASGSAADMERLEQLGDEMGLR